MTVKVSRLDETLSEAVAWEVEGELVLETSSKVLLDISPEDVISLVRDGDDLIVEMANGQTLKIAGFYSDAGAGQSELYLLNSEGGVAWADLAPAADNGVVAAQYVPQPDMAGFEMVAVAEEGGSGWIGAAILGGAAAAGLAAAASDDGSSDDSDDAPVSDDGSDDGSDQDSDGSSDQIAPPAPQIEDIRDDTGGVIGLLASGDSTDDTTPTLSGSAEAGSTITIRDGDTVLGTVIADDSGNWSFTPSEPLAEGSHSLTVTATDAAGNTSEASDAVEVTVDTTAPDVPTLNPSDGTVISGSAEPGSTINVDLDGDGTVDLTIVADETTGEWSAEPSSPLVDASIVTVTATDAAGNTSPEASLTVDAAAPATPSIAEVADDEGGVTGALTSSDSTDDTSPTLSGTAEAGSTVTIFDGDTELGTVEANGSGNWTFTPTTPLAEGSHSLTVTATDPAGNTSEPSSAFELSVDTNAPDAPLTNPTDGTVISGKAEPGCMVEIDIRGDGTTIMRVEADPRTGDWSVAPSSPLTDGTMVVVVAIDEVGNISPTTSVAVDTSLDDTLAPAAPTISVGVDDEGDITGQLASGDSTDDTTPTLSGRAEAGSTVTIFDGDTELGTVEANGSGTWTFTPTDPLAEGSHSLTVTATDAADNTSDPSDAFELSVDTEAPEVPAIVQVQDNTGDITGALTSGDSTDDTTPALSGTAEAGSTVTIFDGDTELGSVEANGSGTWTFTPTDPLAEGSHSLTVTATDAAGNTSEPSDAFELSVDTTSPGGDAGTDAPTLAIAEAEDDSINAAELSDGVQASVGLTAGTQAGDTLTLQIDNADDVTYTVTADDVSNGSATVVIPSDALTDGDYSVAAVITDAAGNSSAASSSVDFTVDATSPGGDAGTDAPTLAIA
ncbi:Ig-like domain-containing protein, partial [Halomonas cupida]|uniref:Ig-like domain-containing protein n=1 Tax=Halomonas cupida TaxID=44933 RepID=UPI003EF5E9F7